MKKLIMVVLMLLYLYGLTLNVFISSLFRVPTPLMFGIPLVFLYGESVKSKFTYRWELVFFFITTSLVYLIAYENTKTFFVTAIVIVCCALYFNYFIGNSLQRLKISVWIFYGLLTLSALVMLLNHVYPGPVNNYRRMLTGVAEIQSPSGLTPYIFSFGYQLAALVSFLAIACSAFKKNLVIHLATFTVCGIMILYGMNRSVFVGFVFSAVMFWMFYYKLKTGLILGILAGFIFLSNSSIKELSSGGEDNILAKNERKSTENRDDLLEENIKIIADNPYGLAFYGKSWNEVAGRNPAFKQGETGIVTSHNAFLMFITYMGIIPGLMLLFLLHRKIIKIFWAAIKQIRKKENALLICLCFSFLSTTLNALFHNEWLGGGSGPTVFLYFCILQLSKILKASEESPSENLTSKKLAFS